MCHDNEEDNCLSIFWGFWRCLNTTLQTGEEEETHHTFTHGRARNYIWLTSLHYTAHYTLKPTVDNNQWAHLRVARPLPPPKPKNLPNVGGNPDHSLHLDFCSTLHLSCCTPLQHLI